MWLLWWIVDVGGRCRVSGGESWLLCRVVVAVVVVCCWWSWGWWLMRKAMMAQAVEDAFVRLWKIVRWVVEVEMGIGMARPTIYPKGQCHFSHISRSKVE